MNINEIKIGSFLRKLENKREIQNYEFVPNLSGSSKCTSRKLAGAKTVDEVCVLEAIVFCSSGSDFFVRCL